MYFKFLIHLLANFVHFSISFHANLTATIIFKTEESPDKKKLNANKNAIGAAMNRPMNINTGFGNFGVQPSIPSIQSNSMMQAPFPSLNRNLNSSGAGVSNLPPPPPLPSIGSSLPGLPPISLQNNPTDIMFNRNSLPLPSPGNQLPGLPNSDNLMPSSRINNLNGNKRGK